LPWTVCAIVRCCRRVGSVFFAQLHVRVGAGVRLLRIGGLLQLHQRRGADGQRRRREFGL